MLIFNDSIMQMHNINIFLKYTVTIDPLPQRTLCTIFKMMTILDDPLKDSGNELPNIE